MTYRIPLTVNYDSIREVYMVRQASNGYSQSQVPTHRIKNGEKVTVHYEFEDKKTAYEQLRRMNKWIENGGDFEFQNMFTDGLFETVADTKYGCSWN